MSILFSLCNSAELDSDHANVTQAPILNVFTNGGWTTFMDGVRINGELFTGNSVIAPNYTAIGVEVPGNSTIITLDTGTSDGTSGLRRQVDVALTLYHSSCPAVLR